MGADIVFCYIGESVYQRVSFCLLVFGTGSFYNIGWPRTLYVIHTGFNILSLLPQFPGSIGMHHDGQAKVF